MGDRYWRSDISEVSIWISIWNMGNRHGIWYIGMVIYHIVMVILDIDMGGGLMMLEMTVSIRSYSISIWISRQSALPPIAAGVGRSCRTARKCAAAAGPCPPLTRATAQGLTLIHFSAQIKHILWDT